MTPIFTKQTGKWTRAAGAFLLAAALSVAPCFLSGCMPVRFDESAVRSNYNLPYASSSATDGLAAAPENTRGEVAPWVGSSWSNRPVREEDGPESEAGPPFRLLRVKYDPEGNSGRNFRAVNMAGDPRAVPTPADLREARSLAQAQVDIYTKGDNVTYRSDGSAEDPAKVKFVAASRSLRIDFAALADLNRSHGQPHAVDVVVYHLSSRFSFDRLAANPVGRETLLDGGLDDAFVKSHQRFTVQPGETGRLEIDRPEGGKFVAIIAGYEKTAVHVTEYGVGRWVKKGDTMLRNSKYLYAPLPLHIRLGLTEDAMIARDIDGIYDSLRRVAQLDAASTRHLTLDFYK